MRLNFNDRCRCELNSYFDFNKFKAQTELISDNKAIVNRTGFVATMDQTTFSEAEYQTKKRKSHREVFPERMDKLIPWKQLEKKVAQHYLKGQTGRPPYPLPTMLRVHCMQLFYNLSDPAIQDALYEIESMRHFARLKLDRLPDETTILKFRHFL